MPNQPFFGRSHIILCLEILLMQAAMTVSNQRWRWVESRWFVRCCAAVSRQGASHKVHDHAHVYVTWIGETYGIILPMKYETARSGILKKLMLRRWRAL